MSIERRKAGVVDGIPETNQKGKYLCYYAGTNIKPVEFASLSDVKDFLLANADSGVRMRTTKGFNKIVDNIFIDGVRRHTSRRP
jgi:hypothetical protein